MTELATPWLDSYPPGVPERVEVPPANLSRLLDDAARQYPNAPALYFEGRSTSYAQLANQAWRMAGALAELGVTKGTRVGLVLPNCPQAVVALFGALRLGAVVVQHNPLYPEHELAQQLEDAEVEVVICLDLAYERVKAVRQQLPVREVVVTSLADELPLLKRLVAPYTRAGREASAPVGRDEPVRRWRGLLTARTAQAPEAEVDAVEEVALLQYTGGTTGRPKGVMLSHYNLRANTEQLRAWFPAAEMGREVAVLVLPFFHVYGLTVGLLLGVRIAAAMVLLPRFELGRVVAAIDRYRPTLLPGVPTMYAAIAKAAEQYRTDLSSIKACLSGAAPLPRELAERFERISGGRLVEGYGLSECSPVAVANPVYGKRKAGSIGMPLPSTLAKIVDPNDPSTAMPTGTPGELAIKGPQVMRGYWRRPQETAEVLLPDGWLLTGDIAVMDEEGYFSLVDRKKEVILVSGFNVYPSEVERVLAEHPAVLDAAVVGVPDPRQGESVKAFVVLQPGQEVATEELRAFVRERLAPYKVPRTVEVRSSLPRGVVGKVLRRALLEEEQAKADEGERVPAGEDPHGQAPGAQVTEEERS